MGYEYYINDTDNWHLDKDILGDEDDRMYSANNCVLVPNELNVTAQTKKRNKPYRAYININGKSVGLNLYD